MMPHLKQRKMESVYQNVYFLIVMPWQKFEEVYSILIYQMNHKYYINSIKSYLIVIVVSSVYLKIYLQPLYIIDLQITSVLCVYNFYYKISFALIFS